MIGNGGQLRRLIDNVQREGLRVAAGPVRGRHRHADVAHKSAGRIDRQLAGGIHRGRDNDLGGLGVNELRRIGVVAPVERAYQRHGADAPVHCRNWPLGNSAE